MPAQPLGPTGLLAQSMTLPAGSQSMAMGGMAMRAQGMDGRKRGGALPNWLALSGGGGDEWVNDCAVDPRGNLATAGSSSSGALMVARFAADGSLLWAKEVAGTSVFGNPDIASGVQRSGIATDAAGAVYAVALNAASETETYKFSSDGALLWARRYIAASAINPFAVAVANSGSLYVAAATGSPGYGSLLLKYSGAGVFQWSRNIDLVGGGGVALDSAENIYLTDGASAVAKVNSAGAVQWVSQYASGFAPTAGTFNRISASPSGETYIGCRNNGVAAATLYALNNSGAVSWVRTLASDAWWQDVLVSGSSVYCIGAVNTGSGFGGNDILMAEYSTDGTLKWQTLIGTPLNDAGFGIAEAGQDALVIAGATRVNGATRDVFIGRVSKGGPPSGRIGPYSIKPGALSASSQTSTFSIISPLSATYGSDAASALTPSAIALPTTVYTL